MLNTNLLQDVDIKTRSSIVSRIVLLVVLKLTLPSSRTLGSIRWALLRMVIFNKKVCQILLYLHIELVLGCLLHQIRGHQLHHLSIFPLVCMYEHTLGMWWEYICVHLPRDVRTCLSSAELIKPLPSLSNTFSPSMKSSMEPCSFFCL